MFFRTGWQAIHRSLESPPGHCQTCILATRYEKICSDSPDAGITRSGSRWSTLQVGVSHPTKKGKRSIPTWSATYRDKEQRLGGGLSHMLSIPCATAAFPYKNSFLQDQVRAMATTLSVPSILFFFTRRPGPNQTPISLTGPSV